MSPNLRFMVPTAVSLRRRVGERMISACVVPTVTNGGVMVWGCFAGDGLIYLEFKAHLTSMATTAFCSDSTNQMGYHSFFNRTMTQQLQAVSGLFDQEGEWWSAASDDLASTITWPQPNWDGLGVGHQSEVKAANKCSAYVGTPSKRWKSIPCEAGWENAKSVQSCHQGKGWLLKNRKYICLTLFWLLHNSMCIV